MESVTNVSVKKKEVNKGAWTAEEDRKLAEAIEVHGAKRWKIIATKAGLFKMARRIDAYYTIEFIIHIMRTQTL